MTIKTKTVEVKADADNGSIVGYAATWTRTPDSYGDVIVKGAFAESIERIQAEGKALPLLWNHDSYKLDSYIGTVTKLEEDEHGLLFEATFDATDNAQRARELAMDGRLCKFSFAYDVKERADVQLEDGRLANELRKLDIHEVSLVMYPANRDTSVVEVKSANVTMTKPEDAIAKSIEDATGFLVQTLEYKMSGDAVPEIIINALAPEGLKTGRRNSKADEDALRDVLDHLSAAQNIVNGLIAEEAADEPDEQEPEAEAGEAKAASEEPGTANGEEPAKANPEELGKANDSAPEAKTAEVDSLLEEANEILSKKEVL